MTVSMRAAVAVTAPADQLWAELTAWERQGDWIPLTTVWSENGNETGGLIFARTAIGRLGFVDSMQITRFEPPRRCEVRHTGRVVRGDGVFRIDPIDGGRSRVEWEELLEPPLGAVGRLGLLVIRPMVELSLWWALRRFARRAVSRPR